VEESVTLEPKDRCQQREVDRPNAKDAARVEVGEEAAGIASRQEVPGNQEPGEDEKQINAHPSQAEHWFLRTWKCSVKPENQKNSQSPETIERRNIVGRAIRWVEGHGQVRVAYVPEGVYGKGIEPAGGPIHADISEVRRVR
jgi:hypothetical protein